MSLRDLNAKFAALNKKPEPEEPLPIELENAEPAPSVVRTSRPPQASLFQPIGSLLPQAPDIERCVLSCLVQEAHAVARLCVERGVSGNDFWLPHHKLLFELVMEMWEAGDPVDVMTISGVLHTRKQFSEAGGPAYVTELQTFAPGTGNADYYISVLRETTFMRNVALKCDKASKLAKSSSGLGINELIDELRADLEGMGKNGPKTRFPPRRDMKHLMNGGMPPEPEQVIGGVLHRASKMVVGGTSKGRKTWALMDLAISVAAGVEWWGFKCTKGRVCYINFEIQEAFFARRSQTICAEKRVVLDESRFDVWTLRGFVGGIETMADDLIRSLQWEDYTLIVIDPIYKALGDRDENKAGDVASMLNLIEKVAVKTGAAIAFGAHYSKGNQAAKESIDRIGGSGVFARDPDSILTMTAHEEEECFTVDATLRNFAPVAPFVVRWKYPLFARDAELNPEQLKPAKKTNTAGQYTPKFSAQMILDHMSALDGVRTGEIYKTCSTEHGVSRATFYRLWDGLQKEKRIITKGIGEWVIAPGKPKEEA